MKLAAQKQIRWTALQEAELLCQYHETKARDRHQYSNDDADLGAAEMAKTLRLEILALIESEQ